MGTGTPTASRDRSRDAAVRTGVQAASSGLVVVTTPSGYASPLAQAIDEGAHPSIAGTLAGDKTISSPPRMGHRHASRAELASYLVDGPPYLWSGRVGGSLESFGVGLSPRRRCRASTVRLRGELQHARRLHGAGLLSDDELAKVGERLAEIALDPAGYLAEDEDVHSAIERQLGAVAARSTPAGRATTRSRRRSASMSLMHAPRRDGEIEEVCVRRADARRRGELNRRLLGGHHLSVGTELGNVWRLFLPRLDR